MAHLYSPGALPICLDLGERRRRRHQELVAIDVGARAVGSRGIPRRRVVITSACVASVVLPILGAAGFSQLDVRIGGDVRRQIRRECQLIELHEVASLIARLMPPTQGGQSGHGDAGSRRIADPAGRLQRRTACLTGAGQLDVRVGGNLHRTAGGEAERAQTDAVADLVSERHRRAREVGVAGRGERGPTSLVTAPVEPIAALAAELAAVSSVSSSSCDGHGTGGRKTQAAEPQRITRLIAQVIVLPSKRAVSDTVTAAAALVIGSFVRMSRELAALVPAVAPRRPLLRARRPRT